MVFIFIFSFNLFKMGIFNDVEMCVVEFDFDMKSNELGYEYISKVALMSLQL